MAMWPAPPMAWAAFIRTFVKTICSNSASRHHRLVFGLGHLQVGEGRIAMQQGQRVLEEPRQVNRLGARLARPCEDEQVVDDAVQPVQARDDVADDRLVA